MDTAKSKHTKGNKSVTLDVPKKKSKSRKKGQGAADISDTSDTEQIDIQLDGYVSLLLFSKNYNISMRKTSFRNTFEVIP